MLPLINSRRRLAPGQPRTPRELLVWLGYPRGLLHHADFWGRHRHELDYLYAQARALYLQRIKAVFPREHRANGHAAAELNAVMTRLASLFRRHGVDTSECVKLAPVQPPAKALRICARPGCHKPFAPVDYDHVFCSKTCCAKAVQARRFVKSMRVCAFPGCGREFRQNNTRTKYCSHYCRDKAYRHSAVLKAPPYAAT